MKMVLILFLMFVASNSWGLSSTFNACTGCLDYMGSSSSGSGGTPVAVSSGSSSASNIVSSPTTNVLFDSRTFIVTLISPSTSFIQVNPSSFTLQGVVTAGTLGALTTSSATATYLQASSATATYLQTSSATATYCNANGTNCTASASGSGGYALQPATVTIQAAQGIIISSTVVISTPTAVITTTSTITSTMAFVEASCAFPNTFITLTLPTVFSSPGFNTFIYKVNATTCQVRIQAAGSDTIEGSGTMHLDGFLQHASLHATNVGWGAGVGGIQYTPERLYINPYQQGRTFVVAASSTEVICPLIVPVPVIVMGYAYDGLASGAFLSIGTLDQTGANIVSSTGPVNLLTNTQVLTTTPYPLPPGSFNLSTQLTSTVGKLSGSDSSNAGIAGCSRVAGSSPGIFATTLPGAVPGSAPGISVLVAGGRQTYQ